MKKYAEIMDTIQKKVVQGEIVPGSRLPSIRSLAQEIPCSINTVIKAYKELEQQHVIYSVPQSGYFLVKDHRPDFKKRNSSPLIDFQSAGPDQGLMPYIDYKHCINEAIDLYKEAMFAYSDTQGLPSLRHELARQLQELQVFTERERIVVVTGSQQALHLLISLPFPNGKHTICVEQPTHPSMIESLRHQNARTTGIEIHRDGPDLSQLEHIFRTEDIKFFYTVSRFHNPTGYSYSNKQRKRIVELAQKYDVFIVEDDYMGDLDHNKKQDPMFAFDPSERVIYTKSFSKVLLPGLRLGLVVLPDSLKENFLRGKFGMDVHTPVLTQGALEIYLKSGMYGAHIHKLRNLYHQKGIIVQKAYQNYLPANTAYTGSNSGFYSSIELPHPLKATHFVQHLKKEGILLESMEEMYLPDFKKLNTVRLSVSKVDKHLIPKGILKIGKAIEVLLTNWV